MSTSSKSLASYTDCQRVMDIALERPGLLYELDTTGQAVNFRMRCHRFRSLLLKLEEDRLMGVPGLSPSTAYDTLVIRFANVPEGENVSNQLRFDHRSQTPGKLLDPDTGQEIKVDLTPDPDESGDIV